MSQNFKKDFPLLMNDPVIYLDNGCDMWYNNLTKHNEIKDFYVSENIET